VRQPDKDVRAQGIARGVERCCEWPRERRVIDHLNVRTGPVRKAALRAHHELESQSTNVRAAEGEGRGPSSARGAGNEHGNFIRGRDNYADASRGAGGVSGDANGGVGEEGQCAKNAFGFRATAFVARVASREQDVGANDVIASGCVVQTNGARDRAPFFG
jgi:hypothetical protein